MCAHLGTLRGARKGNTPMGGTQISRAPFWGQCTFIILRTTDASNLRMDARVMDRDSRTGGNAAKEL